MQRRGALTMFAFVLILGIRGSILYEPPFDDQAYVWGEAIYLQEHHFNYWTLRYEEPFGNDGGLRTYTISVMPTLWAIALTFLNPRPAFAAAHLFNFLCAAASAECVVRILQKTTGWWLAVFAALAFLSTPLVLCQMDMIGLYIPFTWLTLLMVEAYVDQRPRRAAWLSFAAFIVKATGLLLSFALVGLAVSQWWRSRRDPSLRLGAIRQLQRCFMICLLEIALIVWANGPSNTRFDAPPLAIFSFKLMPILLPDVAAQLLIAIGVALAAVLWGAWESWRRRRGAQSVDPCPSLSEKAVRIVTIGGVLFVLQLAAIDRVMVLPRYFTSVIPLALILPCALVGGWHWPRQVMMAYLLGLITINVANHSGELYPQPRAHLSEYFARYPHLDAFSTAFVERSLEYRASQQKVQALCDALSRAAGQRAVFVCEPFDLCLRFPKLGYSTKSVNAIRANEFEPTMRQAIRYLQETRDQADKRPIFLYARGTQLCLPSPGNDSTTVFENFEGTNWSAFVAAAPPIGLNSNADWEKWYLDATWAERWAASRFCARFSYYQRVGFDDRARLEFDRAWQSSDDEEMRRLLNGVRSLVKERSVELH